MRKFLIITFVGFAIMTPLFAMAADANLVVTDLPSASGSAPVYGEGGKGPLAIIVNFYQLALLVGGALAFAMVLYGAIKYMTAGGSHNTGSEAKSIITQAFLGLLLLAGAYFVLSIINPDLTTLQLPFLSRLERPKPSTGPINVGIGTGQVMGYGCITISGVRSVTQQCYADENACNTRCNQEIQRVTDPDLAKGTFRCQLVKDCVLDASDPKLQLPFGWKPAAPVASAYGYEGAIVPAGMLTDAEARGRLRAAGITVTGSVSQGNCLTATQTGCTSLTGIHPRAIDGLIEIAKGCNCSFRVTGGTEAGHQTHRIGEPIVDVEGVNTKLNDYIYKVTGIKPGSQAHMFIYPGTCTVGGPCPTYMWEEYDDGKGGKIVHWHLVFKK